MDNGQFQILQAPGAATLSMTPAVAPGFYTPSRSQPGLRITTTLVQSSLSYASVHNSCRALITLTTPSLPPHYPRSSLTETCPNPVPIDFIVMVDISSSMKEQ